MLASASTWTELRGHAGQSTVPMLHSAPGLDLYYILTDTTHAIRSTNIERGLGRVANGAWSALMRHER